MRNLFNDESIPVPSDVRSFPGIEPAVRIPLFPPVRQSLPGGNPYKPQRKELSRHERRSGSGPPTMFRIAATTPGAALHRSRFSEAPDDQRGPARLVARSEASPCISVKILVKEKQVAPIRIAVELRHSAVAGTGAPRTG